MYLEGVKIKGSGKVDIPAISFVDTRKGQVIKSSLIENSKSKCIFINNVPDIIIQDTIIMNCQDMGL